MTFLFVRVSSLFTCGGREYYDITYWMVTFCLDSYASCRHKHTITTLCAAKTGIHEAYNATGLHLT